MSVSDTREGTRKKEEGYVAQGSAVVHKKQAVVHRLISTVLKSLSISGSLCGTDSRTNSTRMRTLLLGGEINTLHTGLF